MPLVEQHTTNRNGQTVYLEPNQPDYRAVISQIKREILVEISGRGNGSLAALDNISDAKLKNLLTQTRLEARRRGLLNEYDGGMRPQAVMNIPQTFLAMLLFPSARRKLEQILAETALGGLELLQQAKNNIATMMEQDLF